MTDPNYTYIHALLDRSGSMHSCKDDTEMGWDAFIRDQRQQPGLCTVGLTQFDDEILDVYDDVPIHQVGPLRLQPRGGTALLDALGVTITKVGRKLSLMNEHQRPGTVLFVVLTDGKENASREYRQSVIKQMITHQREVYDWGFVYLGANQDAITVGDGMGIPMASSITYNTESVDVALMALSNYTSAVRGRAAGQSVSAVSFSKQDRDQAIGKA